MSRDKANKSYPFNRALVTAGSFVSHFFLLTIRLFWGGLLILTGIGKYLQIHGVASHFETLGLPAPLLLAYIVGTIEFLGGLFLILGLYARFFSLVLSVLLIAALLIAHGEAVSQIFIKPTLLTKEEPFLFLYTALVIFCFGPGLFSFDYFLKKGPPKTATH